MTSFSVWKKKWASKWGLVYTPAGEEGARGVRGGKKDRQGKRWGLGMLVAAAAAARAS
jgi:hypothetical protein